MTLPRFIVENIDRAQQFFMGVLGHDLRTYLHVILISADRLTREPSKEQIETYVPHIKRGANSILGMVEDLLDVARTRLGGNCRSIHKVRGLQHEVVGDYGA